MTRQVAFTVVGVILLLGGCSAQSPGDKFSSVGMEIQDSSGSMALEEQTEHFASLAGAEQADANEPDANAAVERKIIYTAELGLVVDDLSILTDDIPKIVAEHGGYLSDSSVDSTQGVYRTGRWQARVPVDRFSTFLESVARLGVAETRSQTANDVTEQYVDLQARISSKKKLEERILDLLENSVGKIEEVLEVERELARVRTEVESMEGRLRFLHDRTSMTTVNISAREERDYVPPEAPTFTAQIAKTWAASLDSVRQFFSAIVLLFVGAAPWLVIIGAPLGVLVIAVRRRRRRAIHSTGNTTPTDGEGESLNT